MSTLSKVTMFCKYCDALTIRAEDVESKQKCGMCRECELLLYQPNRERFDAGWQPSDKEISQHRKKINKRVTLVLKNIDNYL